MYSINSYNGSDLPAKTLCLTYDDGPGIYTEEIARFLYNEGIQATFFVVGKYAFHYTELLLKLKQWGHLIGNHTYDHPETPFYVSINGDIQNQIIRTDAIIKNFIDSDQVYFRSPYGTWSAEVANELNTNFSSVLNHVGPIHWDVAGIDCYYWQTGRSINEAVTAYLDAIREKTRGIIVMHDDIADMDYVKAKNNTLELTKTLIPLLKEQGYHFVRLDQIESIKKAAANPLKVTLVTSSGECIALKEPEQPLIKIARNTDRASAEMLVEDAGYGKVTVKAGNGLYFNVTENNEVQANSSVITDNAVFDWIPIHSNGVIFRASNGGFLTKNQAKLIADGRYIRNATRFYFLPANLPVPRPASFKKRLAALKSKLLYVKSKLLPAE